MADTNVNTTDNVIETQELPSFKMLRDPELAEVEIQASQVINRLEEALEAKQTDVISPKSETPEAASGPGPLLATGKEPAVVLQTLEDLMCRDDNGEVVPLPALDDASRVAVVSHSLAALVTSIDPAQLKRLATRVVSDTSLWLSRLFRFYEGNAYFHEDCREGVARIARMLLHTRHAHLSIEGFEALASRLPMVYISAAARCGTGQYICSQLGLPQSCLRVVPCNTLFGSQHKMDVAALERMLQEDKAAQKVPLLVLANAGTPITGHVDNLPRLQEICRQYEAWLHVEGNSLAALAMITTQNLPTKTGDSLTLSLGRWLGTPGIPYVTLYRAADTTALHASGLSSPTLSLRLSCLPLWSLLQVLGHNGVQARIREAFELSEMIGLRLAKYPCIRLLSPPPGGEGTCYTVAEVTSKPASTAVLLEVVVSSVVFQFVPVTTDGEGHALPFTGRNIQYHDNLNSWLGQILQRDASQVPIEILDVEGAGYALRCCPLEILAMQRPSVDDVQQFLSCVDVQLDILLATVKHRMEFSRRVSTTQQLQLVEMMGWAGLGGVRYIPTSWPALAGDRLTDQAKAELNALNVQLVEHLRSTDAAFSLGEGQDGLACVRFGMVTEETDVEELLNLVVTVGAEIEESSRFIDTMSEIVKKGIETATQDLQRENEERLWQDGIFRHVPLVGTFVNWWSPPAKEVGVRGRSLNLTAGVVESTENIYRYHMQIAGGGAGTPPGTRLPPQPEIQTPITPSPRHSRSSSHSSQQSQQSSAQQTT